MAHFAEINNQNIVKRIIVVHNNELLNSDGVEQESLGISFCQSLFGGNWKQTSFNGNIRKNFAGIGFSYDSARDAFIPPKPFNSWTLDEETCQWQAPIEMPDDGSIYIWNEEATSWSLAGDAMS
jgi:hypothetical protein